MAKEIIAGDRREQHRYPVELSLEYKIIQSGAVVAAGIGTTSNMSSGGVMFRTGDEIRDGAVELSIRWPAVLGNEPFIELCIVGRLVRNDENGAAVATSRYSFQKIHEARRAYAELFVNALLQ